VRRREDDRRLGRRPRQGAESSGVFTWSSDSPSKGRRPA
jgi:hypothetical protein